MSLNTLFTHRSDQTSRLERTSLPGASKERFWNGQDRLRGLEVDD